MHGLGELEAVVMDILWRFDEEVRVREVLAQRRSVSVLTVVCGPDMPDADIARWSSLAGPDVDTGVVRVSPGGTPARSQIGRTAVADCPALADLPRLVRRGGGS